MKNGNNQSKQLSKTPKLREPHKMRKTKLSYMITLPKIEDEGFLCFAEGNNHLPFEVKRFYYIADVMKDAKRGFHAHHNTRQVLFCIKGSITVVLDNGFEREKVIMDQSNKGIFLDAMMWHEMEDFTEDTVLLVAASEYYDEKDYIRDYKKFSELAAKKKVSNFKRIALNAKR